MFGLRTESSSFRRRPESSFGRGERKLDPGLRRDDVRVSCEYQTLSMLTGATGNRYACAGHVRVLSAAPRWRFDARSLSSYVT